MNIYSFYIPPSTARVGYPDFGDSLEDIDAVFDYAWGDSRAQAKHRFMLKNDVTDWTTRLHSKLVATGVPDEEAALSWVADVERREEAEWAAIEERHAS